MTQFDTLLGNYREAVEHAHSGGNHNSAEAENGCLACNAVVEARQALDKYVLTPEEAKALRLSSSLSMAMAFQADQGSLVSGFQKLEVMEKDAK